LKCFTIGYGGREPQDFINLLKQNGIKIVVDVRLKPYSAYKESYVKAKDPNKGIQALLRNHEISYLHIKELGNRFLDNKDWAIQYEKHLEENGYSLISDLIKITEPFCLLCAEKKVEENGVVNCHRKLIADYLFSRIDLDLDYEFIHIE